MWLFIFSIIFLVLGVIALGVGINARTYKRDYETVPTPPLMRFGPAALLFGAAALLLVFASTTIVSSKNVGVLVTFGRPSGTLSNGLHFKLPWQTVVEMEGTIQNENRTDNDATQARLGNDSIATVTNSIQWRIKPEAADSLYLDYRTFENVRDNLVIRQANAALNDVLATYNPIAAVQGVATSPEGAPVPAGAAPAPESGSDNQRLANEVVALLRERVGDRIQIENVLIPVIKFDDSTQSKLDAYQAEIANTRIAQQNKETAIAQAAANDQLRASVSNDPNVLVNKCLDIVAKNGGDVLGCWPGVGVVPTGGR